MDKAAIDIAKALARLSELTIFELRGEWQRLHRMPPPMRLSRDLLIRGIIYQLQERAYGGGGRVRRPARFRSVKRFLVPWNHGSERNRSNSMSWNRSESKKPVNFYGTCSNFSYPLPQLLVRQYYLKRGSDVQFSSNVWGVWQYAID
jgi:hypothetical protein